MNSTQSAEPLKNHGLAELAARRGWRHLEHTRRGNVWLSERTVFRDTVTGRAAWRMTCDPSVNVNDYYDIPVWNADGSLMAFLSRRETGERTRWLMNADGSNLRPMPSADGKPVGPGYWSILYPDRFYHAVRDDKGTHVVADDPLTGKRRVLVSAPGDLGAMMPPHPTEEWFLFGVKTGDARPAGSDTPSKAFVLGLDGTLKEVQFERRWHRLRFTKSPDLRLFFNYDDPRTQWTILSDGTDRTSIPWGGGHPDWSPDGNELTWFNEGTVWGCPYDGSRRRTVMELESGGHGGPFLDGEWFASDTPPGHGKYPGSIICFRTDGSQECQVLFKAMASHYSHTFAGWHPDHHSTHPHPNSSPDGTKVIFSSDFLGEYADVYVVINRLPDPPRDLTIQGAGAEATLRWDFPEQCRETRGYLVYRRSAAGADFERLTDQPINGPQRRVPQGAREGEFVVTALEWSGLESSPSNLASARGAHSPDTASAIILDTTPPETPSGVQVAELSPNTLRLEWEPVSAPDLDHYNVYCGSAPDVECSQSALVGSPSENEWVDWGLGLDRGYWYRLTAVDRSGNESAPSGTVRGRTPSFEPVRIELSTESATVQGMSLCDGCEEGQEVLSPDEEAQNLSASWEFEVPRAGLYAIWGRSTFGRPEDQSKGRGPRRLIPQFELSIGDGPVIEWQAWGFWGEWHWSPAGRMVTGSPELFELEKGRHALRLKPKTAASVLSAIVITDDPTWWPVEGMRQR